MNEFLPYLTLEVSHCLLFRRLFCLKWLVFVICCPSFSFAVEFTARAVGDPTIECEKALSSAQGRPDWSSPKIRDKILASEMLSKLALMHPIEAWLLTEEIGNTSEENLQSTNPVEMKMVTVPASQLQVQASPNIRPEILEQFFSGDSVLWPRHPFLTKAYDNTPFTKLRTFVNWLVRLSASRSVVKPEDLISIKVGTDRIAPGQKPNTFKLDAGEDAETAVKMSQYIEEIDRSGPIRDSNIQILPEVLAVRDPKSGNGFVVRDLEKLNDGHYYIPGFAIFTIGKEIARIYGKDFYQFWGKYYAESLGRSAATIMLRYGLHMGSMHGQNFLIQLDKNFLPTGNLVFRDTVDWMPVPHLAEMTRVPYRDIGDEYAGSKKISGIPAPLFFQIFLFPLKKNGEQKNLLPDEIGAEWSDLYSLAFKKQVEKELKVKIPNSKQDRVGLMGGYALSPEFIKTANFLRSEIGVKALAEYHGKIPAR
jgi:hypothetical protein